MAIAYDNATSNTSSGTSQSFSHTTSGPDRLLIVYCLSDAGGATVSAITYNSVALTFIGTNTGLNNFHAYYIIAPASGSNTVAITWSTSGLNFAYAVSYTGVLQTGALDSQDLNNNGAFGTSYNSTYSTVINSDCWIMSCCFVTTSNASSPSAGTNNTFRARAQRLSSGHRVGVFDTNATMPTGTSTLGYATGASADFYTLQAAFRAAASASTNSNFLALL